MKNFLKWLAYSSENPEKFSLTLKGTLLTAIPVIIMIADNLHFTLNAGKLEEMSITIVSICTGVITLYGLGRKLYNTYSDKEVVTFTKTKKK